MASTNQSPEFLSAQKRFYLAGTDEEKLNALEEMMSFMPKHKAGESMRANLRERYKKLKEKIETKKKKKSGSKEGIKKEDMQAVLIGFTNSGKSSILACLTNARPVIDNYPYTTKKTFLGTMDYGGVKIQMIDMPAIDFEGFDRGVANTADLLIVVIKNLEEIKEILKYLDKAYGKQLIVFNKSDLLSALEKRKINAFLQSKKYYFTIVSAKTFDNLEDLKEKIWKSFDKIRVYTKEPGRKHDDNPVVLDKNSTVKDIAEKILHGFSKKIKETRVTGPSSKFPNQKVSLGHVLKDKDIIEFHVR